MGKCLFMRKGEVHTAPITGLPSGYTELTYIQSNGTQYIDTGFKPKYNSRVVMDISDLSSTDGLLYGSRNTNSSTDSKQFLIYLASATSIRADYFGTNASLTISDRTARTTIDQNANVTTMFGGTVTNTAVSSGEGSYPMYIFTINNAGSAHSAYTSYKLHSCRIYDNGTLVRDYIPCINLSGDVGLYDLAGKQFYGNAGTGTFQMGTPVVSLPNGYTRLAYIQSSGTQYVDVGFIPDNNTRVVMDADIVGTPTSNSTLFGARTDATIDAYALIWYYTGSYFRSFYNNQYTTSVTWSVPVNGRRIYDKSKETTTIGGTSQSYTNAEFQCDYNLLLLALNLAGTAGWFANAKLYSCGVYDNGVRIRFFIPCMNAEGEVGLYDLVTEEFYGNAGSGTFIAGAMIVDGGILASDIAVGSSVYLNENGSPIEYLVVNQGLPSNSSLYDTSCDGTWLLRKDCHSKQVWDSSNVNDYENSDIHTWLNGEFLSLFDVFTKEIIKQVKIPYIKGAGTSGQGVGSGASGLYTKIFLLSSFEIGLTSDYYTDGACLSYFYGLSNWDEFRLAYHNGTAVGWWLRSTSREYNYAILIASDAGPANGNVTFNDVYYARPALILPSNAIFDAETLVLKGVS